MKIYLAGGAVRDLLLGRPITDRDYLVSDCSKKEFQQTFPTAREVGLSFPVFLLDKTEFSFPRASTIPQELESRDLTVNAQLLDADGNLICHPLGLEDIRNRILRPASGEAFTIDPLRVFRTARFFAQLPDFSPHSDLKTAMRETAERGLLASLSADRVGQEVRKALNAPAPGNFLRLLSETDCLVPWLSEFSTATSIPAGPPAYHDADVLEHTCRIMDLLAGDEIQVWMGLCHDLGKTMTRREKLPHHHGHDRAGTPLAEQIALRLRLPNIHKIAGVKAARWHMVAARYDELRPGTKVDLLMDAHLSQTLVPIFQLVFADHGKDYLQQAQNDLERILPVRLEVKDMNLGPESGKKLRDMRAQALTQKQ